MANKTLFKSLIGKLLPAADAVNEEHAPANRGSMHRNTAASAAAQPGR
jgi:hypothetical protein